MTVASVEADELIAPDRETDDATDDADERTVLDRDEMFHLLRNERRRKVLRFLEGTEEQVRMGNVAEQVAAWENDTTVEALTSKERSRVYIALYQDHLPALDRAGVVEYNQSRGHVRRTDVADQLTPHLDLGEDDDTGEADSNPWSLYYLGIVGVCGILLALSTAFAIVSSQVVGVAMFSLFSTLTGANLLAERNIFGERNE